MHCIITAIHKNEEYAISHKPGLYVSVEHLDLDEYDPQLPVLVLNSQYLTLTAVMRATAAKSTSHDKLISTVSPRSPDD